MREFVHGGRDGSDGESSGREWWEGRGGTCTGGYFKSCSQYGHCTDSSCSLPAASYNTSHSSETNTSAMQHTHYFKTLTFSVCCIMSQLTQLRDHHVIHATLTILRHLHFLPAAVCAGIAIGPHQTTRPAGHCRSAPRPADCCCAPTAPGGPHCVAGASLQREGESQGAAGRGAGPLVEPHTAWGPDSPPGCRMGHKSKGEW